MISAAASGEQGRRPPCVRYEQRGVTAMKLLALLGAVRRSKSRRATNVDGFNGRPMLSPIPLSPKGDSPLRVIQMAPPILAEARQHCDRRASIITHGSFTRLFNSTNARPARRPSLVAAESSSSA